MFARNWQELANHTWKVIFFFEGNLLGLKLRTFPVTKGDNWGGHQAHGHQSEGPKQCRRQALGVKSARGRGTRGWGRESCNKGPGLFQGKKGAAGQEGGHYKKDELRLEPQRHSVSQAATTAWRCPAISRRPPDRWDPISNCKRFACLYMWGNIIPWVFCFWIALSKHKSTLANGWQQRLVQDTIKNPLLIKEKSKTEMYFLLM